MKARVEKMRAAINTPHDSDQERDVTPTPLYPPQQVTTPAATPLGPLRALSNVILQPEFRRRTPYRAPIPIKKQQQRAPSPAALVLSEFGTAHKHKKVMFEKPDKWHRDKDKDTMLFTEWKQKINKHFHKHYEDSYMQSKFWSLKLAKDRDLDDFLSEFDKCAMYVDQSPEQEAYYLTRAVERSRFGPYLVRKSYNTAEEIKAFLRRIDIDLNRQKANEPTSHGDGGGGRARNNNKGKDKSQPERSLLSSINYGMTKAYD
ncbi:unnamed protein product [Zymoseptoria tritici ST99CH_3D1]|nr:unnamed protein product [Zymoseptoria tritici ST99CH_3D1]